MRPVNRNLFRPAAARLVKLPGTRTRRPGRTRTTRYVTAAGTFALKETIAPLGARNALGATRRPAMLAFTATRNVRLAGVASASPVASTARTSNLWRPFASRPTLAGDVHAAKSPASRRHSKRAASAAGVPEKAKRAEAEAIAAPSRGPASIRVSGATIAARVACTRNFIPSERYQTTVARASASTA